MVGRRIAGEYILVPLVGRGADVDSIYHLNPLGAFIWERLDGLADGDAIVAAIVENYDVERKTAAADYRQYLGKLESIHAIREIP
jgi:hypothetical protein